MGRRHRAPRRAAAAVKPKPAVSNAAFKSAFFDCVKRLSNTISRTLTATPIAPVFFKPGPGRPRPRGYFAFSQHGRTGPKLAFFESARFGRIGLFLGQTCAPGESAQYPLRTIEYRYALHAGDSEEPFVRWDYKKVLGEGNRYCRHHVQGEISMRVGEHGEIALQNPYHLPTGYVTIEEILRFCIVDLGAAPISSDWHEILERGYGEFKTKSAPRGHRG